MLLVKSAKRVASPLIGVALLCVLTACGQGRDLSPDDGINDPYETQNRETHELNLALDRALVRPAAQGYTAIIPDEIEESVGNFATNLSMPSVAVNSLLQGDMRGFGLATFRFVLNSTIGVVGLIDAADEFGVADHTTDFGETLHVWGTGEGPYVELPVLGPSTRRDAFGKVVDLFTNPLTYVVGSPENYYGAAASAASRLGDRGRYSSTVDSILYESADSYSQARLIYLQNRRFELGQEDAGTQIDPFDLDTEGF